MLTDGTIKRVKIDISKQANKLDTIPVRRNGQAAACGSPFLWPVASGMVPCSLMQSRSSRSKASVSVQDVEVPSQRWARPKDHSRKSLAPCHLVENGDRTKCCDAVVFSIRANTRRTHCSKVPYVFDDLVRARKQYRWDDQPERFSVAVQRVQNPMFSCSVQRSLSSSGILKKLLPIENGINSRMFTGSFPLFAQRHIAEQWTAVAGAPGRVAIELRRRGSCTYGPWLPSR
jgi:hypothetical protein